MQKVRDKEEEKKKKTEKKPKVLTAEYEIVTVQDGKNLHTFESKPLSEKVYEAERFVKPRTLNDRFHSRIKFLVVFKDKTAVSPRESTKITSDLLYIAQSSNTLGNALKELFRKPFSFGFGGKKILFIGVIAVVGAIVYLVYTGQVKIPGF